VDVDEDLLVRCHIQPPMQVLEKLGLDPILL
jgi:hypothetical protein